MILPWGEVEGLLSSMRADVLIKSTDFLHNLYLQLSISSRCPETPSKIFANGMTGTSLIAIDAFGRPMRLSQLAGCSCTTPDSCQITQHFIL